MDSPITSLRGKGRSSSPSRRSWTASVGRPTMPPTSRRSRLTTPSTWARKLHRPMENTNEDFDSNGWGGLHNAFNRGIRPAPGGRSGTTFLRFLGTRSSRRRAQPFHHGCEAPRRLRAGVRRNPGDYFVAFDVSRTARHCRRRDGARGRGDSGHHPVAGRSICRPVLRSPGPDQIPSDGTSLVREGPFPPVARTDVLSGLEDFLKTFVDARKLRNVPVPSREDPSVSVLEVLQGVAHGVLDVLGVHVLRDRGRNRVQTPDEIDRVGPITQFVEVARL